MSNHNINRMKRHSRSPGPKIIRRSIKINHNRTENKPLFINSDGTQKIRTRYISESQNSKPQIREFRSGSNENYVEIKRVGREKYPESNNPQKRNIINSSPSSAKIRIVRNLRSPNQRIQGTKHEIINNYKNQNPAKFMINNNQCERTIHQISHSKIEKNTNYGQKVGDGAKRILKGDGNRPKILKKSLDRAKYDDGVRSDIQNINQKFGNIISRKMGELRDVKEEKKSFFSELQNQNRDFYQKYMATNERNNELVMKIKDLTDKLNKSKK